MLLRPLRAEDGSALRALLEATGAFTPEEIAVAMELIDLGEDQGRRCGYRFTVADDGAAVVGYTCYGQAWFTEATWDLYWIAVEPGRHRQGIGGMLLAAAESAAAAEHGRTMLSETASKPSYEPARRLYENNGYVEVARIPDFYAERDDKIVYAKRLGDGAPVAPLAAGLASTRVGESPGRGRGVFAQRAFAAGETIERANILVFSSEQWEQHVVDTDLTNYCFRWGEDDEDGAIGLGNASLYNHSFSPSARYVLRIPERQIEFIALRGIEAGEEITVNYNRNPEDLKPVWFEVL